VIAGPVACFTFDHLDEGTGDLLDLLDRRGVRASCFVEGRHGGEHPEGVASIVDRGHELGMHGWAHEQWSGLPPDEEQRLAARATSALEGVGGGRPVGFRAPGGARTPRTAALLSSLGYRYDASLGDGMRPAVLGPGLAQVPFVWSGVDGAHYLADPPSAPDAVRALWLAALARVAEQGGLFLTICHGAISAAEPARLAVLDEVIEAALADRRVSLRTTGEVAEQVLASSQ
jgi:peptidoglycan/xylan/chitin deacetylase (PgdA/CDA1 family)